MPGGRRKQSAIGNDGVIPTEAAAKVTRPVAAKVTKKVTRRAFVQPSRRIRGGSAERYLRLVIRQLGAQAAGCRTEFPNVCFGWKADMTAFLLSLVKQH